jgi:hypothetical protein
MPVDGLEAKHLSVVSAENQALPVSIEFFVIDLPFVMVFY